MKETVERIKMSLASLAVFGSIKDDPAMLSLSAFLDAEDGTEELKLDLLSDFVSELYEEGGDLPGYLLTRVLMDEDPYLRLKIRSEKVPEVMERAVARELAAIKQVSSFTPAEAKEIAGTDDIPEWTNSEVDFEKEYRGMIESIPTKGYGLFAKYNAFTVSGGELVPVEHEDSQTIEELYGYERERNLVLENTRALAESGHAANMLLYGDAGTGKSSTIKACANRFYGDGVRLIEFSKDDIPYIPDVIDQLYTSPLKFIFYIDDLSFSSDDDSFCHMKGILEGTVTGRPDNIVIYATSNRRHLVKETAGEREGDDIHVNDTLQQTMSLSARFGIMVTFLKPDKDLYVTIVKHLAEDNGIDMPEDELASRAERFAIRANGRSPRTAKQFIELLTINSPEL